MTVRGPQVSHVEGLPPMAIRAWLRYDVVARVLDRIAPQSVLEIGCGQGAFGTRLAGSKKYVGVEPDEASFRVARSRIEPRGGQVIHGTHRAVPAGAAYDVVCFFEVLEHIDDDQAALAEWVKLVRPGGHIVMSVPAFQERFGPMDEHAGHFRRYSPDELASRLHEAGLEDVRITVYGWPLGYALEMVRNRIDSRRLARAAERAVSVRELTAASGRTFQPSGKISGLLIKAGTLPFRYLQRARRQTGIGLVAVGRRPFQG